ncbi:arsenate reductase (glutaredoxin) [Burkholderiales bacterium]|nr:arsenate reductase (glutaredoxin) [Burkholderiales bacterium]
MVKLEITLYHNPRCSKSRNTLALLQKNSVKPLIVEYLKAPLNFRQIAELCKKLNMSPTKLLRTGEAIFKEYYLGQNLSDEDAINAMISHPILMERPIIVCGDQAIIGRPPENALTILKT